MIAGITTIFSNIGLGFESTVLLVTFLAGLLFYVKDFKIGVVGHFLTFGVVFLWFLTSGYNYTIAFVMFMIFLIIMSLTLYTARKTAVQGGLV